MAYYNQNNYDRIPYPSSGNPNGTVKTSGCGVCCASMVVEGLTGKKWPPIESTAFSLKIGARASGGTDMIMLSKAISKLFGLKVWQTKSIDEAISAVRYDGAFVITNAKGGDTGLFSNGGHFIMIERIQGPYAVVWDPGLYTGKYDKPWRKNKVTVYENDVFVTPENLDADIRKDYASYFIFTKVQEEKDEMAQYIEQLSTKAGVSVDTVIDRLALLIKNQDQVLDNYQTKGVEYLKDKGVISVLRDGRAQVNWGDLGTVLSRME
ncbi:MAG: hypothetical protein N2Z65_01420 [Clostridiales bacterium]|nr:hypothetical protein [Clostridiales bacterium]